MRTSTHSARNATRWSIDSMRLFITTSVGVIFGVFLGTSYPAFSLSKMNLTSSLSRAINFTYIEDKYSDLSPHAFLDTLFHMKNNIAGSKHQPSRYNVSKIWVPTNPHGAERLPPGIVVSESDLYPRRTLNLSSENLSIKSKYLVTFTVGADQKNHIDAAVKKFSDNFTIMLFHYDGRVSEWNDFEWSNRAIHVSAERQAKWWYAKRFLHPDIVASFEYIFIWDEDLGVEHFDGEEYIRLVKKYNLHISQPGLDPQSSGLNWEMTKRKEGSEVHKIAQEKNDRCRHPLLPPCAAFVEIMATVFSHSAWRCVWYMLQNDLVHGWGLDFAVRKCVEPAHETIGVVDSQWIVHQSIPSLGNQGKSEMGKAPWEGVRARCVGEWKLFHKRLLSAEISYYASIGIRVFQPSFEPRSHSPNSTDDSHPPNSTGDSHPLNSTGHTHPLNSTGHSHPINSMGHTHPLNSTGHSHPLNSTGHTHPLNSTGHSHPLNSTGH